MNSIESIAESLGAKRSGSGYVACCPAHDDKNPSLSISEGAGGKVLYRCHAGCEQSALLAAVRALTIREAPSNGPGRKTRYEIRDTSGEVRAIHERLDFPNGSKSFTWKRPDGRTGLNGTKPADLPLYGAHLLPAIPLEAEIVLTEGQKAADALRDAGFHALGTVTGASGTPSDAVLDCLHGRTVVLWSDNDDVGRKHMQRIAAKLKGKADVRRFEWKDAPVGGDAADYLASHPASLLAVEMADAKAWGEEDAKPATPKDERAAFPRARTMAELCANTAPIAWAVYGLLMFGLLTLLVAREKAGKTTLIYTAFRALASGAIFFARSTVQTNIVLLTEEGDSTVKAAAELTGLSESTAIHVLSVRQLSGATWGEKVAHLWGEVDRVGATILVVDTAAGCAEVEDENDSTEATRAMRPLQVGLQSRPHVAALVAMHANKACGRGVSRPTDMLRGATGWAANADLLVGLNLYPRLGARARVLTFEGRVPTPARLFAELGEDGTYDLIEDDSAEGLDGAGAAEDKDADLLRFVPATGHGITPSEFAAAARCSRAKAHRFLKAAHGEGRLRRKGAGTGRAAFRYTQGITEGEADA